jgi:DNA replication protein DnaC
VRNYKKEYQNYQGKPEQIKNRAARNKARRLMEAKGRVRKGDGKDVDHKDMNPRNNSIANLRIQSKSKNRARNGQ